MSRIFANERLEIRKKCKKKLRTNFRKSYGHVLILRDRMCKCMSRCCVIYRGFATRNKSTCQFSLDKSRNFNLSESVRCLKIFSNFFFANYLICTVQNDNDQERNRKWRKIDIFLFLEKIINISKKFSFSRRPNFLILFIKYLYSNVIVIAFSEKKSRRRIIQDFYSHGRCQLLIIRIYHVYKSLLNF